jgi:hypothetical protein
MMQICQWDIARFRIRPQDRDLHPGIVLSGDEWCSSRYTTNLNILACSKRVPGDGIKPHQVILDGADGLEFQTTTDCRFFFVVPKECVAGVLGRVSYERRRVVGRKINEVFRLMR